MLHRGDRKEETAVGTINLLPADIEWEKPADLSSRDMSKRMSSPAVESFFKICEHWQLRNEDARQRLGGVSMGLFTN